jgi:CBS domain-containing protein
MRTVKGLLESKGGDIVGISPHATVFQALSLMAERNIGAVVVLDDDRLVGILSERDYARKVILLDRSSRVTSVAEIMTPEVETVAPEESIDRCMELMTAGRFRHLPVVEDDRVVGVISIGDVVKAIIEQQQALIGDLERYITG